MQALNARDAHSVQEGWVLLDTWEFSRTTHHAVSLGIFIVQAVILENVCNAQLYNKMRRYIISKANIESKKNN